MKTIITQRARGDLRAIARYIAQDNPKRAITFINELTSKCDDIATMPEAFQLVEGYEARGLRRRVHGNYLIYYYFSGQDLFILHIRNANRKFDRSIFGDD